jgi:hypothetical protein
VDLLSVFLLKKLKRRFGRLPLLCVMLSIANGGETRGAVSVIDFGADPRGQLDSAPAFRAAIQSNRNIYVPPGTYKFSSTVEAPCCAYDPVAVLVNSKENFSIIGERASIVVGDEIALSSAFHFEGSKGWTISGLVIRGNRHGLTRDQENVGIAISNNTDFNISDIHFASGLAGNGAGFAGNWNMNGTIENIVMDNVAICTDFASAKNILIKEVVALGSSALSDNEAGRVGHTCFSFIRDAENLFSNRTSNIINGNNHIIIENSTARNFSTSVFIEDGKFLSIKNNIFSSPGIGLAKGLGIWVKNPVIVPGDINKLFEISENTFENIGRDVAGYAVLFSSPDGKGYLILRNKIIEQNVFCNINGYPIGIIESSSIKINSSNFQRH